MVNRFPSGPGGAVVLLLAAGLGLIAESVGNPGPYADLEIVVAVVCFVVLGVVIALLARGAARESASEEPVEEDESYLK